MSSSATIKAVLVAAFFSFGYWSGKKSWSIPTRDLIRKPRPENRKDGIGAREHGRTRSDTSNFHTDGDLSSLQVALIDDCMLVLVVRTDLGMSTGKIAAQCSHATLACYKTLSSANPALLRQWERTGQTKIALRCSDEDELLLLHAQAQSLNLCSYSVQDAGRTQIVAGSRTVLGIAGPVKLVNQVTGQLGLL